MIKALVLTNVIWLLIFLEKRRFGGLVQLFALFHFLDDLVVIIEVIISEDLLFVEG